MTCKDCFHYEACKSYEEFDFADHSNCDTYKDKSKIVELPCNIGDKVYHIIRESEIIEESIYQVRIYDHMHIAFSGSRKGGRIVFREDDIGKTVFLTKEEAEARLKELQNEKE